MFYTRRIIDYKKILPDLAVARAIKMIKNILIKKGIRETLSDKIIQDTDIVSLEKKIDKMVYAFPKHENRLGRFIDDIRGMYRYYINPSINTNKRAYTKMLYNDLKRREYSDRLAITLAKATPVAVQNKYLKGLLAIGYGITMGRNMSERHFNWVSKKSGISEKVLMRLSFLSEPPMHLLTAGQLYPQIYAVTKGISETIKRVSQIDINITPDYLQIYCGLCAFSMAQYIFYETKKRYVRAYHGATSLPFGAAIFWMSTAHNKYLNYQENRQTEKTIKQSENLNIP